MSLGPDDPSRIGRYQLVARLGSGGMGDVFLGQSADGCSVAVKTIHRHLARDEQFVARFAREVAAARAVGGAYTAAVIDADCDGPLPWLATEYIPAPSLKQIVEQQGPLPMATVEAIAVGITHALDAIHQAGVVHRDLTPANVLLSEAGPRIIDFGIAKALSHTHSLTGTGSVIGSPGYLSPEHFLADDVGPAADVYSMGAVLVFACTGDGPFGQAGAAVMMRRVLDEAPQLTGIPPGRLRDVIAACLAKDPGARPNTAWIRSMLGSEPVTVRLPSDGVAPNSPNYLPNPPMNPPNSLMNPPSPPGKHRPGRRTVLIAGLAGVGVALAGAGAVAVPRLLRDNDSDSPPAPAAKAEPGPGQVRWKTAVRSSSDIDWKPPAVANGLVFSTTDQNNLYALDAATGAIRWQGTTSDPASSGGPIVVAGTVVVETKGMTGYDAVTGAILWQSAQAYGSSTGLFGSSELGVVYANASVHGVIALDAKTGQTLWTTPTDGAPSGPVDLAVGAGVVAAVDNGVMFALDALTGAIRWRTEVPGYACVPHIGGTDTIVIKGVADDTQAYDIASGALLWTFDPSLGEYATVDGDAVYMGGGHSYGGYTASQIVSIHLRTGKRRWMGGKTGAPPTAFNGTVFAVDESRVRAHDAATGAQRWECAVPGAESAVAVADGTAYVYGAGHVYAIVV